MPTPPGNPPSPAPGPPPRRAGRLGVLALAGAALVIATQLELTVRRVDRARVTFDSAEYAVAGREWARTGRPATRFILPREAREGARPPFPLLLGHPMVPALDALAFRLAGEGGDATLVPPALAYLALVATALALARALGAAPAVALAAAGAVALAPGVLAYASEGLTEIPFALLLALLVLELARGRPPGPLRFGALLGLAHLTRPVVAPLLPVALAALAVRSAPGARLRTTAVALAAFLPFAGALALYKGLAVGDPLADVTRPYLLTGLGPGLTAVEITVLLETPPPWATLLAHPGALAAKLAGALPRLALALFSQAGPAGAFAAAGLAAALLRGRSRAPAAATLGFGLTLALLAAVTVPSPRYLAPLLPLMLVAAALALERAGRATRLPVAAVALPALLVAAPQGWETARAWRWSAVHGARDRGVFSESEWRGGGRWLAQAIPPRTVVASDAGAFVAWYADRTVVQLPRRPADLATLVRRVDVAALALTNEWLLERPGFEPWREIADDPGRLPGWRHVGTGRSGRLRVVLLARSAADGAAAPPARGGP